MDGDGYFDIGEIIAGAAPNDPDDYPGATAAPAATTTPTPEEPGFEAVFAIAGLLAIAYLVLRKKE